MNIFITGGAGFLGSEISKLLSKKHRIYIYDVITKNKKKNIFYIKGDISNQKKIRYYLVKKKIDTILHFAASLGVKNTEENPLKVIEINIKGTINLLECIKKTRVKKIIFASSSEIYGDNKKKIVSEKDLTSPKSVYGHTKITGEEILKTFCRMYKINFNIVRFFNICGKNQRNDFVISKFAELIRKEKPIPIYGNGNQIRCFCHVKDAAIAVSKLLKNGKNNEIYNIGNNSEPIKIINLAKKMIKMSNKKITIKKIPFRFTDRTAKREIYFRIPNLKKVKRDLNFRAKINLSRIISEILQS
jgi:UDP-glucose 4-epimerase